DRRRGPRRDGRATVHMGASMRHTERVADNLNGALHRLFERDPRVYLLGEDLLDPYGGAFKISRGLSDRYPDRVLATPLSEGGFVGVANGLALCGDKAIVEIMFGDFIALSFDQIVNFATKSVSMYGRTLPLHLVVRCPVGGNRGYGPTHSQSPQKHFIGVPHLGLYELSPFHYNGPSTSAWSRRAAPAVPGEPRSPTRSTNGCGAGSSARCCSSTRSTASSRPRRTSNGRCSSRTPRSTGRSERRRMSDIVVPKL